MSLTIPITFTTRTGELQLAYLDENFTYLKTQLDTTNTNLTNTNTLLNDTIAGLDLSTIDGVISPSQLSTGHPTWDASSNLSITGKVGIGLTATTAKLEISTAALGTTATNSVDYLRLINTNANTSYLRFYQYRNANGVSWDTTSTRIQQRIDVTDMAYLEFNPPSGNYGLSLGTENTERLRITREGGVSFGATGTAYGSSGNILQSNGNAPPSWVASGPKGIDVFYPCYFTGVATAGTLTTSSVTQGYLQAGASTFTLASVAGTATASQTGTTLSLSSVTGTITPGAVITYPAFSGTITSSTSTLTVTVASAGSLRSANTIVLTTGSFTAIRAVTTGIITVSGFTGSVPLAAGMTVSRMTGFITSQLTGTAGSNGTYQSSATTAVASGASTATTTLTISGYGSGSGGAGTYTITSTNGTFTTFAATPATAGQTSAVTVTAFGTGVGSNGNYTVDTSLTAASSSVTTSAAGSQAVSITAGSGSSWTISPALTFGSQSLISNTYKWTVPSGVNAVKYHLAGAGGGGAGGSGGIYNAAYNTFAGGSQGGAGGYGGRSAGIYTSLTPGSVIDVRVANKGIGTAGTVGLNVNIGASVSNTVSAAATAGNGNTTLGPSIYATSGGAGQPGGQVTLIPGISGGNPGAATGADGATGTGSGGTFNGSTNLVFWFSNGIGYAGAAGGYGFAQQGTKNQSALYNNGSAGGNGVDGIVVIEY